MKAKVFPVLIMSVLFTAIGLVCGWYGAARALGGSAAHDVRGATDEHGAAADQAHAGALILSAETLANMGVRVTEAALTDYSRCQPITAVVAPTPRATQGVYAPVAGRVQSIDAEFGAVVAGGDVVVTLVRTPLARAALVLTEEVIKPVSENLHGSVNNFHRATIAVDVLEAETKRLEQFASSEDGIPLLPKSEILKVRYELMHAERELVIARHELERHGLSEEQLVQVEEGRIPMINSAVWRGALEHNGFWTPLAQEVYSALPERLQSLSWTVATLGELVAGNLLDRSFVEWLGEDPHVADFFLEIGGMLQRGHSFADIRELYSLGALEPVVRIKAPGAAPDWDVSDLLVKPGQPVGAGDQLLLLENPRALIVRAEPTSSEIEIMIEAMTAGVAMAASPLTTGAGPELDGLTIRRIYSVEGGMGTVADIPVVNRPLIARKGSQKETFRSWELRQGQRYTVRVPIDVYEQVYVFPVDAVIDDGPDKVVFLKSGDSFTKIKVEVLYQDHEVVVIPGSADFFPGNPIVTSGTLALGLANETGPAADDGHGHAH